MAICIECNTELYSPVSTIDKGDERVNVATTPAATRNDSICYERDLLFTLFDRFVRCNNQSER